MKLLMLFTTVVFFSCGGDPLEVIIKNKQTPDNLVAHDTVFIHLKGKLSPLEHEAIVAMRSLDREGYVAVYDTLAYINFPYKCDAPSNKMSSRPYLLKNRSSGASRWVALGARTEGGGDFASISGDTLWCYCKDSKSINVKALYTRSRSGSRQWALRGQ